MKFQTAVNKLKKMAKGKHCAIQYELCIHHNGKEVAECCLYIDGTKWYSAKTWHKAFHLLENPPVEPDDDEAPEGDNEIQV